MSGHWVLCDDCGDAVRPCSCDEHTEDHFFARPLKWGGVSRTGALCGNCEHERDKMKPDFKL